MRVFSQDIKRFAVVGAGFWANAQLHAWETLKGAQCVAIVDKDLQKAEGMAKQHGIENYYGNINDLLKHHQSLDFIDVITDPPSHVQVIKEIASHNFCPLDIITQKPIAPSYQDAEEIVRFTEEQGKRLWVHENWRWQSQIREVYKMMETHREELGSCMQAKINCGWSRQDTYAKQPMLKTLRRLIIAELGPHLFDTARFFFGEATSLSCEAKKMEKGTLGEDNAEIHMRMVYCSDVTITLSYTGDPVKDDYFPQTLMRLNFESGFIELQKNYKIVADINGKK